MRNSFVALTGHWAEADGTQWSPRTQAEAFGHRWLRVVARPQKAFSLCHLYPGVTSQVKGFCHLLGAGLGLFFFFFFWFSPYSLSLFFSGRIHKRCQCSAELCAHWPLWLPPEAAARRAARPRAQHPHLLKPTVRRAEDKPRLIIAGFYTAFWFFILLNLQFYQLQTDSWKFKRRHRHLDTVLVFLKQSSPFQGGVPQVIKVAHVPKRWATAPLGSTLYMLCVTHIWIKLMNIQEKLSITKVKATVGKTLGFLHPFRHCSSRSCPAKSWHSGTPGRVTTQTHRHDWWKQPSLASLQRSARHKV